MEDHEYGAIMAAYAERDMNTKLAGSRDLRHNRTDWRQHLATRGNVQQRNMGDPRAMPPMNYPAPPPNYPPPQPPPTK